MPINEASKKQNDILWLMLYQKNLSILNFVGYGNIIFTFILKGFVIKDYDIIERSNINNFVYIYLYMIKRNEF